MTDYAAFGTLLKIGDGGATEAFTTVASVLDISGPGLSLDTDDITNHSSTGGYEEVIPTIIRTGELSFEVNFDPADDTQDYPAGLLKDLTDKTKRNFKLVFPDSAATEWLLPAYVTSFEPAAPVGGKLSASVVLKVTGQPTLA
jgi:hypothetical protein